MILGGISDGFHCEDSFGSFNGKIRNLLKTGCMDFQFLGSLSLYTPAPTFALTSNGLYHLSLGFFIGWSVLMLVASSQTAMVLLSIPSFPPAYTSPDMHIVTCMPS